MLSKAASQGQVSHGTATISNKGSILQLPQNLAVVCRGRAPQEMGIRFVLTAGRFLKSLQNLAHLERGAGAALGAARGALLLKELPPTRPPDRAASASSGTAADRSNDAANAALASLTTCKGSSSCFFCPHTVMALFGEYIAGLLLLKRMLPRAERWRMPVAIASAFGYSSGALTKYLICPTCSWRCSSRECLSSTE